MQQAPTAIPGRLVEAVFEGDIKELVVFLAALNTSPTPWSESEVSLS